MQLGRKKLAFVVATKDRPKELQTMSVRGDKIFPNGVFIQVNPIKTNRDDL